MLSSYNMWNGISEHAVVGVDYSGAIDRVIGSSGMSAPSLSQGTLQNTNLTAAVSYVDGVPKGGRTYTVTITGTPTIAGTFYCDIKGKSYSATEFWWRVTVYVDEITPPEITTETLPDTNFGDNYSATVEATGTTPITWSIIDGSLPDGLTLDEETGVISGTPILKQNED